MNKREMLDRQRIALEDFRRKHPNQPLPISRREFITHGILEGVVVISLPSILSELFRVSIAHAADSPLPAFVQIQCDGGPALAGNAMPFLSTGQAIPTSVIGRLGVPSNVVSQAGSIVTPFGVPQTGPGFSFFSVSSIRSALLDGATGLTAAELACVQAIGVPCNSADDGGGVNNATVMNAAIAQMGLNGTSFPIAGSFNTESGMERASSFIKDVKLKPLFISRVDDMVNAVKIVNPFTGLNEAALSQVVQTTRDLSASQLARLQSMPDAAQLSVITRTAYEKNAASIATTPTVDVRQDTQLAPVFGVAANTIATDQRAIFGTMVKSVLENRLGSAAFDIQKCDYHDDPIASANAKDVEIGTRIRQVIRAAILKQRKTVIAVTSNGAVIGNAGRTKWDGDKGEMSYYYMLVVTPPGMTKHTQKFSQVGAFDSGAIAVTNNGIGGQNGREAARAMLINYMAVSGYTTAQIQARFPEVSPELLQRIIAFV